LRDDLKALQQTTDGGYILGGASSSGKSGDKTEPRVGGAYVATDYWVVKLTNTGTITWDKTFGTRSDDYITGLEQTKDGGYIVGGNYYSQYGIVKLKANGTKEWEKLFHTEYDLYLRSIIQTKEGDYLVGGIAYTQSEEKTEVSRGGSDYWILKLASNGSKIWDKTYGGASEDYLSSIQQVADGGFIVAGSSYSSSSGEKSEDNRGPANEDGYFQTDYWVLRIDNSGKGLGQIIDFPPIADLTRTLGDVPFALSAQSSSGLPVSFQVVSGSATIKGNIISLTGTGYVTVKATQVGNATYLPAPEVTQTFLVEEQSFIKKEREKVFSDTRSIFSLRILRTSDGGYLLGGSTLYGITDDKTEPSKGLNDYWIIKLNAAGNKEWDKTFGGSRDDELTALQQTPDGGYIIGGTSHSSKSGDKTEENRDNRGPDRYGYATPDYWVVKVDANGKKEWDKTIGADRGEELASLVLTPDGGYLLAGSSGSNISGDKSEATRDNKDATSKGDFWVVKLDASGKKIWDKTIGGDAGDHLSKVQLTPEGGFLLGGYSYSLKVSGEKSEPNKGTADDNGKNTSDYWIVKLKANGSKDWDKTIGGSKNDGLSTLLLTPDGGYILGGSSSSSISGDKSESNIGPCDEYECTTDYWIVKLNADRQKEWDQTIGGGYYDTFGDMQQTPDGGFIIGGSSDSRFGGDKTQPSRGNRDAGNLPTNDFWVVKLNATGSKEWDRTIGGNGDEYLSAVQVTTEGHYLLGGTTNSGISGDKQTAKTGFYLVQLKDESKPEANFWNMRYGGSGNDNFTDVIKTTDGGYLSGGYTNSTTSGDKTQMSQGKNDYWIVKSDETGQKQWEKSFGGKDDDYLNRVIQTQDGGYLLAGSSFSGKSGDKTEASKGGRDIWVIKVDAQGNKQWDKAYGGSGADEVKKVVQLTTGEYVLGGSSTSPISGDKSQDSQGGYDYWVVKLFNTGAKIWDKRYGGAQAETLTSFTPTNDGGFFLGGSSFSGISGDKKQPNQGGLDYWAVKTDQDGKLVWEKTLGGNGKDEVSSVRQISEDNYYLAGTSNSELSGDKSQASKGSQDYWLVQLDKTGNKVWDKTFGGSKDDILTASTYTEDQHFILAGQSYSEADGDKSQASQGESDYWVVEVDENGQKVQDQRFGGYDLDELRTVTQTRDGGLLLGGRSNSGVSGDRTQPSQGGTDYWLIKVTPGTKAAVAARTTTLNPETPANLHIFTAYPNPFQKKVNVRFALPNTQQATVRVLDSQGREIKKLYQGEVKANQQYEVEWQAGDQTNGMYLLQLQTTDKQNTQKLILSK